VTRLLSKISKLLIKDIYNFGLGIQDSNLNGNVDVIGIFPFKNESEQNVFYAEIS
jgi:hypothetical protein